MGILVQERDKFALVDIVKRRCGIYTLHDFGESVKNCKLRRGHPAADYEAAAFNDPERLYAVFYCASGCVVVLVDMAQRAGKSC